MRYFQEEDVRTKLTDILFCYARENEQLLYKQVYKHLMIVTNTATHHNITCQTGSDVSNNNFPKSIHLSTLSSVFASSSLPLYLSTGHA